MGILAQLADNEIHEISYNPGMCAYIQKKITSLRYALSGLLIAWRDESSFRLEVVCSLLVILLAFFLGLSRLEFLMVIFILGFVLTAEILNTALEELCDKFQPTHDPHIAKIKDLGAAAVLISIITGLIVGLVIFTPHLSKFI